MTQPTTETLIANTNLSTDQINQARTIIRNLQADLKTCMTKGTGPFLAAIYDADGNLIAQAPNTVVRDQCSHRHAEMNAIQLAQQILGTYDLSPYNLSLYCTSEPCLMCLGGILWSGIKAVYYGVPSDRVEAITGFDEGFKPNWQSEFKKRGITVCGGLAQTVGEVVLTDYMTARHPVYRPDR